MKTFSEIDFNLNSKEHEGKKASFIILYSDDFNPDSKEKRILISMRWNSYLGFVGGLREYGETAIENVIRETFEEIHFDLTQYKSEINHLISHFYEEKNMTIDTFECKISPTHMKFILSNWMNAKDASYEVAGINAVFSSQMNKLLDSQWAGSGEKEFLFFMNKHNL